MLTFLHIVYSNRMKPEDIVLLKRSKKDIKDVDHMMINHDK